MRGMARDSPPDRPTRWHALRITYHCTTRRGAVPHPRPAPRQPGADPTSVPRDRHGTVALLNVHAARRCVPHYSRITARRCPCALHAAAIARPRRARHTSRQGGRRRALRPDAHATDARALLGRHPSSAAAPIPPSRSASTGRARFGACSFRRASCRSSSRTSPATSTSRATSNPPPTLGDAIATRLRSPRSARRHRATPRRTAERRAGSHPCSDARAEHSVEPVGKPARGAARSRRHPLPLRRRQRLLPALARPAHGVLVRLLRTPGLHPRRCAASQARPHLPQAAPPSGRAAARRRLRMGRPHHARRASTTASRARHHAERCTGHARARARSRRPASPTGVASRSATIATSATCASTRSPASAWSSTSASRTCPRTSRRSTARSCRVACCSTTASSASDAARPRCTLARLAREPALEAQRVHRAVRLPRRPARPTARRDRRGGSGGLRDARRGEPARALRAHAARVASHRLEHEHERAIAIAGERIFRTWRLYMTASAHFFSTGSINVVQTLLARPDARGDAHMPLTREDVLAGLAQGSSQ